MYCRLADNGKDLTIVKKSGQCFVNKCVTRRKRNPSNDIVIGTMSFRRKAFHRMPFGDEELNVRVVVFKLVLSFRLIGKFIRV